MFAWLVTTPLGRLEVPLVYKIMARLSLLKLGPISRSADASRHSSSYLNARMPRDAATSDSRGSVNASPTNADALLSSIKYSSSGRGALRGKGTATPPACHIPHCVATHANPGVTANAMRSS
jgi:hypothetical protein